MAGFGSGFGGFGQNNNTTGTPFTGFGANNANTNNTGFGAANTGAFGASNNAAQGSIFGGGAAPTGGGFGGGATAGGFGANNNNNAFGTKPTFGTTAATNSGGLFGGGGATAGPSTGTFGGGGFGNNAGPSTTFGGGGGGLFGAGAKSAFGGTTAPAQGGGLFGGGGATTGGFGAGPSTGFGLGGATGLGAGVVGDPPGTAATPFQALIEKEGTTNASNAFQSILFQDAYKKFSAEELRLVDYNQGRRYGNASGGVGAFGATNFGGTTYVGSTSNAGSFGATNTTGGMFGGNNNNTGNAFGANNSATASPFGSGLFGNQNKPATTGLFGAPATSQPAQTGGIFGGATGGFGNTAAPATNGFGTSTATTGGGMFGGNQAKPAFGGFGQPAAANTGAFGANTNTNTNAFGGNTNAAAPAAGGGLFGNTGQTGGLFGNNNQQQQPANNAFGGSNAFGAQQNQPATTNLFSQAQNKPAGTGLFANTGGNLFSGQVNAAPPFGTAAAAQPTGGLFGQKPAATGGIFGSATAQPAGTGTGLFPTLGNANQAQQQPQNSLFGGLAQPQTKSMFGTPQQQTGTGLFGGLNQQPTNSLFGGQQQQQQAAAPGSSLFGAPQAVQAAPQPLTTNINDMSAFGPATLFTNLGTGDVQNPGPLATPLTNKNKQLKRSSILPLYKMNPANIRYSTPQKRTYGFSYSTYGTPASPSSVASTPGSLGQSLLGNTLPRGLNKSVSTSSLRRSFNAEESILSPGAFSAGSSRNYSNTGSIKKLVIDRGMRSDLFSTPSKDKTPQDATNGRKLTKRVSFDTSNVDELAEANNDAAASVNGTPATAQGLGYIRPAARETNGGGNGGPSNANANGARPSPPQAPEMEQVKGKELAVVHEEEASAPAVASNPSAGLNKASAGGYWMKPTRAEIDKMNRVQRQKVVDFTIGRENIGFVRWLVPVDVNTLELDELGGKIVLLETRSATVYPNASKKPPVGRGLNAPALIALEQSWPRGKDKRTMDKHIERLKRIEGTTFHSYDKDTGVWEFRVEHFTTYGLDYDDDTEVEDAAEEGAATGPGGFDQSLVSIEPPSPAVDSDQDDTFEFRKRRRTLPGAFHQSELDDMDGGEANPQSFFGDRSAGSSIRVMPSTEQQQLQFDDGMDMEEYDASDAEGSSTSASRHQAAGQNEASPFEEDVKPGGGVLRARMRALKDSTAPVRFHVTEGDDWMDMLQKTISPQKRDRALLRSLMEADDNDEAEEKGVADLRKSGFAVKQPQTFPPTDAGRGFATSIDLMASLFEKPKAPPAPAKGMKWPYQRPRNIEEEAAAMKPEDRAFHQSFRTTWGPDGSFIFATHRRSLTGSILRATENGIIDVEKGGVYYNGRLEVRRAKFSYEPSARLLRNQLKLTEFKLVDNVPTAKLKTTDSLMEFFHESDKQSPATAHEKLVWELASILFDDVKIPEGMEDDRNAPELLRKETLSKFWKALVTPASTRGVTLSRLSEEKAIAFLAGHRVPQACQQLLNGKDFRLATLLALIGTDATKRDVKEQVRAWKKSGSFSEFADPIRTLYELLSGNVCVCEGQKGSISERMESFVISKQFGLDWRQAFGLRLWYAISKTEDLGAAVAKYDEDIDQGREDRPAAWYVEQGIDPIWKDGHKDQREDVLWGLLKLYTFDNSDLEAILRPENSELSPMHARLSWQLGRALLNTGSVGFGTNSGEKQDASTVAYAAQLVGEGSWLDAAFVLLHLTDPSRRASAIRDHLCRHAGLVGAEDSEAFTTLHQTFRIPAAWIWEAKALHMRAVVGDPAAETRCLLRAGAFAAAHDAFAGQFAPGAVVARDYRALADLLRLFQGHEGGIRDWRQGGEIYLAFLQLVGARAAGHQVPAQVLDLLLVGLPAMQLARSNKRNGRGNRAQDRDNAAAAGIGADAAGESPDVLEAAALADMSALVAEVAALKAKTGNRDALDLLPKVLRLPLTSDLKYKYSDQLAKEVFYDVVAHE